MLVPIVAALIVLVALTGLVIGVVGLAGRVATLRRQLGLAGHRLRAFDRLLTRAGEAA